MNQQPMLPNPPSAQFLALQQAVRDNVDEPTLNAIWNQAPLEFGDVFPLQSLIEETRARKSRIIEPMLILFLSSPLNKHINHERLLHNIVRGGLENALMFMTNEPYWSQSYLKKYLGRFMELTLAVSADHSIKMFSIMEPLASARDVLDAMTYAIEHNIEQELEQFDAMAKAVIDLLIERRGMETFDDIEEHISHEDILDNIDQSYFGMRRQAWRDQRVLTDNVGYLGAIQKGRKL